MRITLFTLLAAAGCHGLSVGSQTMTGAEELLQGPELVQAANGPVVGLASFPEPMTNRLRRELVPKSVDVEQAKLETELGSVVRLPGRRRNVATTSGRNPKAVSGPHGSKRPPEAPGHTGARKEKPHIAFKGLQPPSGQPGTKVPMRDGSMIRQGSGSGHGGGH